MVMDQGFPEHSPKRVPGLAVQYKASDYRFMAAVCLDVASKMPLESERTRITEMAQKWLELAQGQEAEQLSKPGPQALW
jgi:hypothetical protein